MTAAINIMCQPNPFLWGANARQNPPSAFVITDEDGSYKLVTEDETGTNKLNVPDA